VGRWSVRRWRQSSIAPRRATWRRRARTANDLWRRWLLAILPRYVSPHPAPPDDRLSTHRHASVLWLIPRLHGQAGSTNCYVLAGRASSMFDVCSTFARCLLDDCFVFTRSSKHRGNMKHATAQSIAYTKQSSKQTLSKRRPDIEQESSKHRVGSSS